MKKKQKPIIMRYEDLPELCLVEEAAAFLRVSRNTMYECVKAGEIPSLRFGKTIRIPRTALMAGQ